MVAIISKNNYIPQFYIQKIAELQNIYILEFRCFLDRNLTDS